VQGQKWTHSPRLTDSLLGLTSGAECWPVSLPPCLNTGDQCYVRRDDHQTKLRSHVLFGWKIQTVWTFSNSLRIIVDIWMIRSQQEGRTTCCPTSCSCPCLSSDRGRCCASTSAAGLRRRCSTCASTACPSCVGLGYTADTGRSSSFPALPHPAIPIRHVNRTTCGAHDQASGRRCHRFCLFLRLSRHPARCQAHRDRAADGRRHASIDDCTNGAG
jgi:hypothetical protein